MDSGITGKEHVTLMKIKHRLSIIAAVFVSAFMMLSSVLTVKAAEAIDTTEICSLTMLFRDGDEYTTMANVPVHLYHVAEISSSGVYTKINSFASLSVDISNDMTSSQWNDAAATLEGYVASESIAQDAYGTTDQDGKITFSNLAVGLYLVIGDDVTIGGTTYKYDPVLIAMPYLNEQDDTWIYDNAQVPVEVKNEVVSTSSSYKVVKHWSDSDSAARPTSVTINIIKNGAVDHTEVLDDANGWSYAWTDSNASDTWSVSEANVPSGYTVAVTSSVTSELTTYTVTNTGNNTPVPTPSDSELPFTGQTWWPVPLLAGAGLIMLMVGVFLSRSHGKDE
jgi:hypothetical protein